MLELESKEFTLGSKAYFIFKLLLIIVVTFGISFGIVIFMDDIMKNHTMSSYYISIPAVLLLWCILRFFLLDTIFHVSYTFCYNLITENTFSLRTGFTQKKVCDLNTLDMLALKKNGLGVWNLHFILTNYDSRLSHNCVVIKSRNKKSLIKLGKQVSRDFDKYFRF
jgi:hypothetical protein